MFYTGSTIDLAKRIKDHNSGYTPSTRYRRPLKLVYFEEYHTLIEARLREKALKGPKEGSRKKQLVNDFPEEKLEQFNSEREAPA